MSLQTLTTTNLKIHSYDYIDSIIDDILTSDLITVKSNKQNIQYFNIPCAFDIETTSFYEGDEKRAIMYIWQLGLYGHVIIGRNWNEFVNVVNELSERLKLSQSRRLIIYVHNLSYEFQFMRKWLDFTEVFAIDTRKVAKAVTSQGIEFKCSYILTGKSLKKVGDDLLKYKMQKMVGDLNYNLIRNSKTQLNNKELTYCINDVRVIMCLIQEKIESDGNIAKIPLTKTSYVRRYVRNACLYAGEKTHKGSTANRNFKTYRGLMGDLKITSVNEYHALKRAFQGGFTHASPLYVDELCFNVGSFDFTSSYPYVMLSELFPMSQAKKVNVNSTTIFNDYLKKYCCVFDIKFYNLKSKVNYDYYISSSKCYNKAKVVECNGRVVSADSVTMTITEIDFEIIKKHYTWDKIALGDFYIYKKGRLPQAIINSILKLYVDKTQLKGVEDKNVDYLLAKELLNACYGMIVTDICREEQLYKNNEWQEPEPINFNEKINEYNNDLKRFLFYPWGVYVTAYARRNLWYGIDEFGWSNDYIYSDTDSIKCLNPAQHLDFINKYNQLVRHKLKRASDYYNIDFSNYEPTTIKGDKKLIGVWDNEGDKNTYIAYKIFKTLGAKRYMYLNNKYELSLTVSGLNKHVTVPYLLEKYGKYGVFQHFNNGLYIEKGATGKQIHTYVDNEINGVVTDYNGVTAEYHEKSYIHLDNSDYSLGMKQDFIEFIERVKTIIM